MRLVLDTHMYLHYRMFDEIDWASWLGTQDVKLVVPITVIHELDRKKYDAPSARIRERARTVLRRLERLYSGDEAPRNGVKVTLRVAEPSVDWRTLGLSESSSDDRLLAEVMLLQQETGDAVCLITDDTGLWLKARARSIQVRRPPVEWLLQETDERDRRIKLLEAELGQFKQRQPYLELRIVGANEVTGVKHVELDLRHVKPLEPDVIEARVRRREEELRRAVQPEVPLGPVAVFKVPPARLKQYEEELREYLDEYARYLRARNSYLIAMAVTVRIGFILSNSGGAPADDIEVILHFPDYLRVLDPDDLPPEPTEPKPPRPPQFMDSIHDSLARIREMEKLLTTVPTPRIHRTGPFISEESPSEVRYFITSLKHGFSEDLPEIALQFPSPDTVKRFHIEYIVAARNTPKHAEGRLHVIPSLRRPE